MSRIILPKPWNLPEALVTPKAEYVGRRKFLKTIGAMSVLPACGLSVEGLDLQNADGSGGNESLFDGLLPAQTNETYAVPERPLTAFDDATRYNNYYEFTTAKNQVWRLTGSFRTAPWTIEIAGLTAKPGPLAFEDILRRFPLEERIYRHRCVETWAMTVPWTGFPLSELIDFCEPLGSAKYVRFISENRPKSSRA